MEASRRPMRWRWRRRRPFEGVRLVASRPDTMFLIVRRPRRALSEALAGRRRQAGAEGHQHHQPPVQRLDDGAPCGAAGGGAASASGSGARATQAQLACLVGGWEWPPARCRRLLAAACPLLVAAALLAAYCNSCGRVPPAFACPPTTGLLLPADYSPHLVGRSLLAVHCWPPTTGGPPLAACFLAVCSWPCSWPSLAAHYWRHTIGHVRPATYYRQPTIGRLPLAAYHWPPTC